MVTGGNGAVTQQSVRSYSQTAAKQQRQTNKHILRRHANIVQFTQLIMSFHKCGRFLLAFPYCHIKSQLENCTNNDAS